MARVKMNNEYRTKIKNSSRNSLENNTFNTKRENYFQALEQVKIDYMGYCDYKGLNCLNVIGRDLF